MDEELYTLEEVENTLPEISLLLEEAIAVQQELKHVYASAVTVQSGGEKTELSVKAKKKIRVLTEELNDIIEEMEEMGVVVRDLDTGIVDFPARFQGKDIYFCWKIGEERINFWHEQGCGFDDRQRIYRIGE